MSEVIDKPKKRDVTLQPARMALREQLRQDWVVNAEAGTTIEDVLEPQFWAHMATQLEPYARVEVLLETGEWMLELMVVSIGRNWAKVQVLHHYELEKRAETLPAAQKHRIEWKGPQLKHVVIRNSDNAAIQDGFAKKVEAEAWLAQYETKVT